MNQSMKFDRKFPLLFLRLLTAFHEHKHIECHVCVGDTTNLAVFVYDGDNTPQKVLTVESDGSMDFVCESQYINIILEEAGFFQKKYTKIYYGINSK